MKRGDAQHLGDEERGQRQQAIERLAREAISSKPAEKAVAAELATQSIPARRPEATRRRVALLIATGLCIITMIGAAIAYTHARSQAKTLSRLPPSVITVSLSSMGYFCPTDATWSPNSEMLAVAVAYADKSGCDAAPHGILILDASGRKVLFQSLDRDSASPDIMLTWTPDGASVVGLFYRPDMSTGGLIPVLRAFPVTTQGSSVTIVGTPHLFSPDMPVGFSVWDFKRSALVQTYDTDLAPAQSYRWQMDGQVAPVQSAAPSSYAGSPKILSKSAVFSFWQPGYIVPQADSPSDQPQAETYQSLAVVWSPDGRYLAMATPFRALLPFNHALHQHLPDASLCHNISLLAACASPPLALPDAAFAAVRAAVDAGSHTAAPAGYVGEQAWDVAPVAWMPDGALLAAILPDSGFLSQQPVLRVTLYSAQSGAPIAYLTAKRANENDAGPRALTPVLMWAPDGKRLLLTDYDSASITIWSGHALPDATNEAPFARLAPGAR